MALEFSREKNPAPASDERRAEILADPGFGDYFTDHMVSIDWNGDYKTGGEWSNARVHAYGPLSLDPAAAVFTMVRKSSRVLKATVIRMGRCGHSDPRRTRRA